MLFNSFVFILVFLPIVLAGFYLIGKQGHHRVAISWLVAASLFFYGWWNPNYLGLILSSVLFNYAVGVALGAKHQVNRKLILIFGVVVNLCLIGYFKYANFFVESVTSVLGSNYHLENIILPLAISFFTFQQIAYLVDSYQGQTREYNFLHYCLFVTFFPQLIAGPIVHHKEMLPQFAKDIVYKLNHKNIAIGITIFIFGLFKKVGIADNMALYATPVFVAAEQGVIVSFAEAWIGSFAYTFQLYFDFSGYSDMAIGLARMFGVLLPLNFNSPYKAVNIVDFWRRWHMTLSRFLRDYLYIPLGGSRFGNFRRYRNLMLTMLLGGLWHGAGWTFVIWGGLHGIYLVINHAWTALRKKLGQDLSKSTWLGTTLARSVTFMCVVVSWVFFRAENFDSAMSILESMIGLNGVSLPISLQSYMASYEASLLSYGFSFDGLFVNRLTSFNGAIELIVIVLLISWYAPNVQEIMCMHQPAFDFKHTCSQSKLQFYRWAPNKFYAFLTALLTLFCFVNMSSPSEFLYFRF